MADRKPIRWAVPLGCESLMGIAAYYLTHEENMRQSFSQPSRYAKRLMPDGTSIEYIMNDVVDCIRITPPQIIQVMEGKKMVWEKLPPLETGTDNIDFSEMTEDPDVSGGYYCTISVINGIDENGRSLPATFSVKAGLDENNDGYHGWSIKQGIRHTDGTYRTDGKSATLLLGAYVDGDCEIIARDGRTEIKKKVKVSQTTEDYYFQDMVSYKYVSLKDVKAGNFTNLIPAIDLIFDDDPSGSWDWLTGAYNSDYTQTNIGDTYYWTQNANVTKSGALVYTFHLSWWIEYSNEFGYPEIAGGGTYSTGTYGPYKDVRIMALMEFDWTVSGGFVDKSSIIYVFVYGDLVATLVGLDDEWEFCHVSDVNDLGSGSCNIRSDAVFVSKVEFMVRMQHLTDNKFLWFTYKNGAMLESGKIDYSSSGLMLGSMYHGRRKS
jgi:hypothetical protein